MTALLGPRFECQFIHYECPHDGIFKPMYLRTNRTNHTKILRCFPHCCPGHRKRSYCGSPLFVHVQILESGNTGQGIPGDEIVVFARFRPYKAKPSAIGQRFAVKDIESSLQSDNPSEGQWIESSRPISGSPTTSWIFKVNPSGRWFYSWGGAATIAMRATEHILEVSAFRRVSTTELELVALTASPPFRFMSFRRGAQSTKAAPVGCGMKRTLSRTHPTYVAATSDPSYVFHRPSIPQRGDVRRHTEVTGTSSQWNPTGIIRAEADTLMAPHKTNRGRQTEHASIQHVYQVPTTQHTSPKRPELQATARNSMESIVSWLQEVPASKVGAQLMMKWDQVVQDICETHVKASFSRLSAGLVPILSALERENIPVYSNPELPSEPRHATELDAVDDVVRLVLRVLLDANNCRSRTTTIDRYLRHGFNTSSVALASAYSCWIEDTTHRAQLFVREEAKISWPQLLAIVTSRFDVQGTWGGVFSYRSFVAQCREQFISQQQDLRSKLGSLQRKRQRTQVNGSTSGSFVDQASQLPPGLHHSARVWVSRMEDVSIEMDGVAQQSLSLLSVVQFWRHLSCVRFDYSGTQLSVASVFNSCPGGDRSFTKLTLDGQYRWFSSLPSGEPTTGTTLMGYVVGDYVGRTTSAGTIHFTTYLWPSKTSAGTPLGASGSGSGCASGCASGSVSAYAWHWTIDATSLSVGSSSTVVSVVVESGEVGRCPYAMETLSLSEKLQYVGRWKHVCELRLAFKVRQELE